MTSSTELLGVAAPRQTAIESGGSISLQAFGRAAVLLASGALLALLWHASGFQAINSDGYYYLTTARNFVETGTFTYDTLHSTNGFHWAWMWILVGISASFKALGLSLDGSSLTATVAVLDCTLYVAAATELHAILRGRRQWADLTDVAPLIAGLVFIEPNLMRLSINGLETALFLFLLLRLVRLLSEDSPRAVWVYVALTLTRIEGVVLAPLVIAIGDPRWPARLRRALMTLVPVVLIFSFDYFADGSLLSNSSQAKAYWAQLARHEYLDAPSMVALLRIVGKDLAYTPGFFFQLLLSIRDDRWLAGASLALIATVAVVAWRRRPLVAERLAAMPLYLLAWYCVVTWLAYKTIYFTPRTAEFEAQFAVKDYQSVWYFAPAGMLAALLIYLVVFSLRRRVAAALVGIVFVCVLWVRTVAAMPAASAVTAAPDCEEPPAHATFVAQNDDGFAYYQRLPVVVLDGLVTGTRLSDGASYLSAVRAGRAEQYLTDLKPRFIRVGTDRLLSNLHVSSGAIAAIRRQPIVHLCGMGDWYDAAAMQLP